MEDGSSLGERIVALPAVKITDIITRNSELTSSKSCNSSCPPFFNLHRQKERVLLCTAKCNSITTSDAATSISTTALPVTGSLAYV